LKKISSKIRLRNKAFNEQTRILETRKKRFAKHRKNLESKKGRPKLNRHVVDAPKVFGVFHAEDRKLFLSFLKELRSAAYKGGKVTINFKHTNKISSEGGLLFKAELFRLKKIFNYKTSFRCLPPIRNKIQQVLKKVGVYDDLNYASSTEPTRDDVVHWCYAHGNSIDGEKYEPILGGYDGIIAESILKGLFSALSEAMSNSIDHAYKFGIRDDGLKYKDDSHDWWMFSQEYNGSLNVVFCDLGVGIPETISQQRPALAKMMARFGVSKDSEVIKFAAGTGKSRTKKSYRGRGLPQMVKVIKEIPDGKLAIFSNKGMLRCIDGNLRDYEYKKSSILGTLILWELPLPEVKR